MNDTSNSLSFGELILRAVDTVIPSTDTSWKALINKVESDNNNLKN